MTRDRSQRGVRASFDARRLAASSSCAGHKQRRSSTRIRLACRAPHALIARHRSACTRLCSVRSLKRALLRSRHRSSSRSSRACQCVAEPCRYLNRRAHYSTSTSTQSSSRVARTVARPIHSDRWRGRPAPTLSHAPCGWGRGLALSGASRASAPRWRVPARDASRIR